MKELLNIKSRSRKIVKINEDKSDEIKENIFQELREVRSILLYIYLY